MNGETNTKEMWICAHNVRSAYNIGAIIRSSARMGIEGFIASGYTPYPLIEGDKRLPHISKRATKQISKTALDTIDKIQIQHFKDISSAINTFRSRGFNIYALEQAKDSKDISKFKPKWPCLVIVGSEPRGLSKATLGKVDKIIEIPSQGSLNVASAAAIAIYSLSTANN